MFAKSLLAAVLLGVAVSQTSECIGCICGIESNGGTPGCGGQYGSIFWGCMYGCNMDGGTCSCGPYQIKSPYFTDCSTKGSRTLKKTDWHSCATDEACAKDCVFNYLQHYGRKHAPFDWISCEDLGVIHNRGPSGAKSTTKKAMKYRNKVRKCCDRANCGGYLSF